MKYPHILEHLKPNEPEEVLVFDKCIHSVTGELGIAAPATGWDNIRHLTGNLFFAWCDNPLKGCVYLGHYETKKP